MKYIYVSTSGIDGRGSSPSDPTNITYAKSIASSLSETDDVTVYIAGGTYYITEPLVFGSADSGRNGHTITWSGYQSTPVISGGKKITGWTNVGGIWQANLTGKVPAGFNCRQIYVNGARAIRSRWDVAFSYGLSEVVVDGENWAYVCNDPAMPATFSRPQDVEVSTIVWAWVPTRIMMQSITRNGDTTTFTPESIYNSDFDAYNWSTNPIALENAIEFLSTSTPDYWYLNPDTLTLYYVPRSGVNMTTAEVVVPIVEKLVSSVSGDIPSNITFKLINFQHTTWMHPTTARGFLSWKSTQLVSKNRLIMNDDYDWNGGTSWVEGPAAIDFATGSNINIIGCGVAHCGCTGVWLHEVQGGSIQRCDVADTSSDGICVGSGLRGGATSAPWALKCEDIVVANNTVHDLGWEYAGYGVSAGTMSRTKVLYNHVYNTSYVGINAIGGYAEANPCNFFGGNEVAYNNIHNVMLMYGDGASIYTNQGYTPEDPLLVHHNYIHDVTADHDPYRSVGIFLDYDSLGVNVSNNVITAPDGVTGLAGWLKQNQIGYGMDLTNHTTDYYLSGSDNYTTTNLGSQVGVGITNTLLSGATPSQWPTATQNIALGSGIDSSGIVKALWATEIGNHSFRLLFTSTSNATSYRIYRNGSRWPDNNTEFINISIPITGANIGDSWAVAQVVSGSGGTLSSPMVVALIDPSFITLPAVMGLIGYKSKIEEKHLLDILQSTSNIIVINQNMLQNQLLLDSSIDTSITSNKNNILQSQSLNGLVCIPSINTTSNNMEQSQSLQANNSDTGITNTYNSISQLQDISVAQSAILEVLSKKALLTDEQLLTSVNEVLELIPNIKIEIIQSSPSIYKVYVNGQLNSTVNKLFDGNNLVNLITKIWDGQKLV